MLLALIVLPSAFVVQPTPAARAAACGVRSPAPTAGLFDMFKETEAQKAAKDRAWREQQEMLERRRDPEKVPRLRLEASYP
eukprot:3015147-Prymnesium_polylepis.2